MESQTNLQELKVKNLKKYQVIVWDEEGVARAEIARRLEMDRKEVYRILERFKNFGSVEIDLRYQNTGRNTIFDEEAKEGLREMISNLEPMELEEISNQVEEELNINSSLSTVCRTLKSMGKFLTPTWTPLLTEDQKNARLNFCITHQIQDFTFRNVVFSDETRFYLNRNTKRVFVLKDAERPQKIKFNPDYSIMIWGAICYKGKVHMEIVSQTLTSNSYKDILQRFLDYGISKYYTYRVWKFQQDGAGPHRGKCIQDFFKDNKIKIHTHPANSPDLNPIEFVWSYLKQVVERELPISQKDLENKVKRAWDQMPLELVRNCIDYLPTYLPLVIDAKGALPKKIFFLNSNC